MWLVAVVKLSVVLVRSVISVECFHCVGCFALLTRGFVIVIVVVGFVLFVVVVIIVIVVASLTHVWSI